MVQPLCKRFWWFLTKLNKLLPRWSSIQAPWYFSKGVENVCPHKNLDMAVYSSFIHNPKLGNTQVSPVGEWRDKLQYIQNMEYYSVLKGSELSSHEMTWKKLRYILLSERSQSEKAVYYVIPTIWHSGKGNSLETLENSVVSREKLYTCHFEFVWPIECTAPRVYLT